jgi:lipoprotein-anchoring transpeptidase ErfK/SrfK
MWEMLAEKFHCTRAYLKALNHDVQTFIAGTEVIGPKVYPAETIPKAASLRINLSETSIEALDESGKIIAFFPCSIAKDKNKRPSGVLTVKSIVPNPDYTFDPTLFADAAKAEDITKKMVLPPGPRNPVGTAWVGLSLPGYGIHGTPEPENISRTQSHGCFRLANWNAEKVLKMVKVGTPIDVEP